ncbi:MAG: hypothetical protein A2297_10230 [Elusimicrobia bacterium RIFOXYB2_FULL_48_7]|nr:MAG: hypothetical protein A2297_10230 [Elusimicrobia bacterium RIFOXYB2_FULL_48_7]
MKFFRVPVYILAYFVFIGAGECAFQYLDVGARPLGMAGAYSCVGDDASVMFWNPAGLNRVKKPEFSTMYSQFYPDLLENLGLSYMSFVYPSEKYGNFGAGFVQMGMSLYQENVFALSYARKLPFYGGLYCGVNLKNLSKNYAMTGYTMLDPAFAEKMSASGYGLDVGFAYDVNEKLSFAFVGKNINEPNIRLVKSDVVPSEYRIGAGYRRGTLALEADLVTYGMGLNNYLCAGAEMWMPGDRVGVRAGFNLGDNEYKTMAMGATFRAPFAISALQVDYGFVYNLNFSESPGNHYFSLGIKF